MTLSIFITGCAIISDKEMYYWEDYSDSLYEFKKEPNTENKERYQTSLDNIIKLSEKNGKHVAPGIFAEYGYRMAKDGKVREAKKYFDMEEEKYPESKVFVKRLREHFIEFDLK